MPTSSISQTIHALNRSFLQLARELAKNDLVEASVTTGLGEETLRALVSAPLTVVDELAYTGVCGFSLRFREEALQDFFDAHAHGGEDAPVGIAKLRLISALVSQE